LSCGAWSLEWNYWSIEPSTCGWGPIVRRQLRTNGGYNNARRREFLREGATGALQIAMITEGIDDGTRSSPPPLPPGPMSRDWIFFARYLKANRDLPADAA
jgi:hypothetical protein